MLLLENSKTLPLCSTVIRPLADAHAYLNLGIHLVDQKNASMNLPGQFRSR